MQSRQAPTSKQGKACFKADGHTFQNRRVRVLKNQHHPSWFYRQPEFFKKIKKWISICYFKTDGRLFTTSGRLLKQADAWFKHVSLCFCFAKIQKKQFCPNQPRQASTVVLVIPFCKMPVKHTLKAILKEDHLRLSTL